MQTNSSMKGVRGILSVLELLIQCVMFLGITVPLNFGLLAKPENMWYSPLYILIPVIASYLIRKYTNNFALFAASNVLFIVYAVIAAGTGDDIFVYVVVMIVFVMYATNLKNNSIKRTDMDDMVAREGADTEKIKEEALKASLQGEHTSVAFVAIMLVGYFVGVIYESNAVMNIECMLCMVFIILQVIYHNMQQIFCVYSINNGKTEFPAKQIKTVNTFVTVTASCFIFISMIIFYNGEYGSIVSILGRGGAALVKFLVKCFLALLRLFGQENDEVQPETEPVTETHEEFETEIYENDSAALLNALAEAFGVVLIAALIILIMYGIKKYVINFNKVRKQGRDTIEFIKPADSKVKLDKMEKTKKTPVSRDVKSVRKIYKNRILYKTQGYAPDLTAMPSELTVKYITDDDIKVKKITGIYEKARYSEEEISQSDIDMMKKLS